MATSIRRGTAKDGAAVGEIFLAARATMTYLPRTHTDEDTRGHFKRVAGEAQDIWIAEREGKAVGFAVVQNGWLEHLYVHPSRFNTGTGSKLFARVTDEHPEGFQLWAFQQNTGARRFYERHGCALAELTDGAGNEEKTPDCRYVWPAPER